MSQYMSVEVSGEMVTELMNEDGHFLSEVLTAITEYSSMGLLKDNAADVAAGMSADRAAFVSGELIALGTAMRDGFNMSNLEQIK